MLGLLRSSTAKSLHDSLAFGSTGSKYRHIVEFNTVVDSRRHISIDTEYKDDCVYPYCQNCSALSSYVKTLACGIYRMDTGLYTMETETADKCLSYGII